MGLEILSDMLFNSLFDESDIEKEKGVVIEEINMSEDNAEDVLMDLHAKAALGKKDGLSLPILGTEDAVRSFNKQMILSYLKILLYTRKLCYIYMWENRYEKYRKDCGEVF